MSSSGSCKMNMYAFDLIEKRKSLKALINLEDIDNDPED